MLQLKKFFSEIPDSYDPMILKAYIKADANQNGDISWFELKSLVQMMKVDFNIEIENFIKRILGREEVSNVEFY